MEQLFLIYVACGILLFGNVTTIITARIAIKKRNKLLGEALAELKNAINIWEKLSKLNDDLIEKVGIAWMVIAKLSKEAEWKNANTTCCGAKNKKCNKKK